jgi:serine protease AprX
MYAFSVDRSNLSRLAIAILTAALAMSVLFLPPTPASSDEAARFIVQETSGAGQGPELLVDELGGEVVAQLEVIGGFVADVPASAAVMLAQHPEIAAVTPDAELRLLDWDDADEEDDWGDDGEYEGYYSEYYDDDEEDPEADDNHASDDEDDYQGSMTYVTETVTRADHYWSYGFYGEGVDVALIDSGVSSVEGMFAGKNLVHGPDLSFESQDPNLAHVDTNGHGTHMAGIIAGRKGYGASKFYGMAPYSRIISLKVATREGITDVSQVIAAINWVVEHRNTDGLNIRVLNLSFGTDGVQDYLLDPLAFAVEQAWNNGIVVVVAAGNDGNGFDLRNPAYDPFVIAVGSAETNGTYTTSDDIVSSFSNCGTEDRHVDVVAPGRSIVSLRNPGSYADENNPQSVVGADMMLGSGTSQAAAVVSGAAALIIDQNPYATPDHVKALLMGTARPIWDAKSICQGGGLIDLSLAGKYRNNSYPSQTHTPSQGLGSLQEARGSFNIAHDGKTLSGEQDIFGSAWNAEEYAKLTANGVSWSGGDWNGVSWSGVSWSGVSWSGVSWSGVSWSGVSWSGVSWSGVSWSGLSWSSSVWSGVSWD